MKHNQNFIYELTHTIKLLNCLENVNLSKDILIFYQKTYYHVSWGQQSISTLEHISL